MAKETNEAVAFLLALGEACGLALEDHDIGITDAVYLFDAMRKIGPALSDIDKVKEELTHWTDADTAELVLVAEQFDIPQENLEAHVKNALKLAGPLIEFLGACLHK
jgi:hypothetical protein